MVVAGGLQQEVMTENCCGRLFQLWQCVGDQTEQIEKIIFIFVFLFFCCYFLPCFVLTWAIFYFFLYFLCLQFLGFPM